MCKREASKEIRRNKRDDYFYTYSYDDQGKLNQDQIKGALAKRGELKKGKLHEGQLDDSDYYDDEDYPLSRKRIFFQNIIKKRPQKIMKSRTIQSRKAEEGFANERFAQFVLIPLEEVIARSTCCFTATTFL